MKVERILQVFHFNLRFDEEFVAIYIRKMVKHYNCYSTHLC